jgi:hypothetical protein
MLAGSSCLCEAVKCERHPAAEEAAALVSILGCGWRGSWDPDVVDDVSQCQVFRIEMSFPPYIY